MNAIARLFGTPKAQGRPEVQTDAALTARLALVNEIHTLESTSMPRLQELQDKAQAAKSERERCEASLDIARSVEHRALIEVAIFARSLDLGVLRLEAELEATANPRIDAAQTAWGKAFDALQAECAIRGGAYEMTDADNAHMVRVMAYNTALREAVRAAQALKLLALSDFELTARLEAIDATIPDLN